MSDPVTIRLDINPVGWKAPTAYNRRNPGGSLGVGQAPDPEVAAYQAAVRHALREAWGDRPVITENVRVDLYFSRRLDTYTSMQSGKPRKVTKKKNDLANMRKSTEDALQKIVVDNDVLITSGWTEVLDQSKTAEGYVEIVIHV